VIPAPGHGGDSGLAWSVQDFRHLNTGNRQRPRLSISRAAIRPGSESPDRGRARYKELQMEIFIIGVELFRRWLPRLGPYVLVEIALPGGTLLALLLYLYRRRNSSIRGVLPLRAAMASSSILAQTWRPRSARIDS
jgi:hypothetical protein